MMAGGGGGFVSLLVVSSMPVAELLLIGVAGAYLATARCGNVLTASARADINRVVYAVFTPALMLASLASTVTLKDVLAWYGHAYTHTIPSVVVASPVLMHLCRLPCMKWIVLNFINRWFMPVNIGIAFLAGGALGWVAVLVLRPPPQLRGLVIASCSAGMYIYVLLWRQCSTSVSCCCGSDACRLGLY